MQGLGKAQRALAVRESVNAIAITQPAEAIDI